MSKSRGFQMLDFTLNGFSVYRIHSNYKIFKGEKLVGKFSNFESILNFFGLR